ncbi:MAG: DUF4965 domain-containing protein [Planctomycetia bacterium]|nr:DUF4965 domain-containing protein [Planctomycetia bacterium]
MNTKRPGLFFCFVFLALLSAASVFAIDNLRVPATPLVVHDPYFSIWSFSDSLTETETQHWTGTPHPMHAMVRVGEQTWRLLGAEPADVPALPQTASEITATGSRFLFENEQFEVRLAFLTPTIPTDLELLSRPATYVRADVRPKSDFQGAVAFYFDAGGELAVHAKDQQVEWSRLAIEDAEAIQMGTVLQEVLQRKGNDVRIDWGYLMLSVPDDERLFDSLKTSAESHLVAGNGNDLRLEFAQTGRIAAKEDYQAPVTVEEGNPVLAWSCSCAEPMKSINPFSLILAYDDLFSVNYFGEQLPCWWKRNGKSGATMLEEAWDDYFPEVDDQGNHAKTIEDQCLEFDQNMEEELRQRGGENYVALCSLAWRQAFGAQKLVADKSGRLLMFSKENFSGGYIGTVDVMYPCSPILLYYNPQLMKATLDPIFDYAASGRWPWPFAPHDLGLYPQALGQHYGGGEKTQENQMPVEECGNMILQTAALVLRENDLDYARANWNCLSQWAAYLLEKGFDPENQLCTDDFAGHLAHNVNLSAKAIIALGAYSKMAELLGEKELATRYRQEAEACVARWVKEADAGDHYRLAFDQPDSWSMKYNLMWDRALDLNLFPESVMATEINWYKKVSQAYGLPLDNRSLYSKNDWILWIAAMTDNQEDFNFLVDPILEYVKACPDRCPLSDWYWTDSAKVQQFRARSVVGGFWAPMLTEKK